MLNARDQKDDDDDERTDAAAKMRMTLLMTTVELEEGSPCTPSGHSITSSVVCPPASTSVRICANLSTHALPTVLMPFLGIADFKSHPNTTTATFEPSSDFSSQLTLTLHSCPPAALAERPFDNDVLLPLCAPLFSRAITTIYLRKLLAQPRYMKTFPSLFTKTPAPQTSFGSTVQVSPDSSEMPEGNSFSMSHFGDAIHLSKLSHRASPWKQSNAPKNRGQRAHCQQQGPQKKKRVEGERNLGHPVDPTVSSS